MTCNTNNTTTPWMNLSYRFSSLNNEINGVKIKISFSSIPTMSMNYTSLCIIISKESPPNLKELLKDGPEELAVQAQKFPDRSVFLKNCTLCMNYRTLSNQDIYYINDEIHSTDHLNLVMISKFHNLTKCSLYNIKRPDFKWSNDLLKAGGLVLLFLSPTIMYMIYRFVRESYIGRVRPKELKNKTAVFVYTSYQKKL